MRGHGHAMIQQQGRSGDGLLKDAAAITTQVENNPRGLVLLAEGAGVSGVGSSTT